MVTNQTYGLQNLKSPFEAYLPVSELSGSITRTQAHTRAHTHKNTHTNKCLQ